MSENEELMNVNPTVAESEPSTDFGKEPFDIFRAVDQANMEAEVNPQETQPAQPLPEDTANQSTQVPSASELESNENNLQNNQPISEPPNGYSTQPSRKYTDDVIDDIVEAARQQKAEVETYRKFFASPMGERAMKQAQADYERIKAAKAEQNPQTPNGDFRRSASDVLGIDENDPFYSQLDNYIGAEVERRTSEQSQFIKQLQQERVDQAKADMGQAYAQHLIQQYGMPENVAAQAAFKAMSEASKKFKTFEPNAYRKELLSFEAEEIVPVAMDIWNKQKAEYESKINSFNQQTQPQPNIQQNGNNPSSTREAAERMLSQQNANYKASGNIPNGGAVLDGYDEGDDVKRFIDFANQSFLG